jgi:hypothetical protein
MTGRGTMLRFGQRTEFEDGFYGDNLMGPSAVRILEEFAGCFSLSPGRRCWSRRPGWDVQVDVVLLGLAGIDQGVGRRGEGQARRDRWPVAAGDSASLLIVPT